MKEKKHLFKAAGIISFSTMMSRISGLIRDVFCARLFGASNVWDAFVYAFMVPNLLRRLVGEGALSSAFIPVYTEILQTKGKREADNLISVIFSFLSLFLFLLSVLVVFIINVFLGCFAFSAKTALTLKLTAIIFPYILFISLTALVSGVLQCHKRFFVPALTPLILNLIWIGIIGFLFYFHGILEFKIKILAYCIVFAGLVQLLFNTFFIYKINIAPKLCFCWENSGALRVLSLMLPAVIGFSVTQINTFVDFSLAMFIGDGANSALWYGNRLMQLPLGIFGIAMATALLPTISKQVADNNDDRVKTTLAFSLETVFIFVVPASVGLIVLGRPIIKLCFERGAFDSIATDRSYYTLLAYSLGLFAYSGIKILVSTFYSYQDTKTPVKVGVLFMFFNIFFNIIFMPVFKEAGLALATALCSILNFIMLILLLRKKIGDFYCSQILKVFCKVSAISCIMGLCVYYFYGFLEVNLFKDAYWNDFLSLFLSIGLGVLLYFFLGNLIRIKGFYNVGKSIGRRCCNT